ncbi:Transcriptional activator FeaR [compost metagenome]
MNQLSPCSDQFQGSDGYQRWESTLAEQCGAFHAEPPASSGAESFQGAIRPAQVAAPGYAGAKIGSNCPHIHRNVKDIKRDGHDFFYLVQQLSGSAVMDHCGTQSVLGPGDLVMLDSARPSDFYFPGMSEQISLVIPRHKLESAPHGSRLVLNRKIASGTRIGSIAGFITGQFFNDVDGAAVLEAVMDALISLVRPTLSCAESLPLTFQEKHQKAYFERAKGCIEDSLANFELTPDVIAREMGTSKRTLHRIFAQHGLSIGRYILDRRLDKCAAEFESQADLQKISAVAFAWGFNDVSHFSRAFKARFGVSPRSFRNKGTGAPA